MAAAILAVHCAAAVCLALVLPAAAGAIAGALVLLLGAMATLERALLRGSRTVRAVELRDGDAAVFILADGRRMTGTLAARRNVSRWWVTLPLRGAGRRTLVVARDMLSAEDFRRLRLWALWGRVANPQAPRLAS
jgi:hypothetical protein